jgi:hypothetical protein
MIDTMNGHGRFAALVLGLGIAVAGWFIGYGFMEGRASARFVTVKGVSERDVRADIAFWPIRFVATSNQLDDAQASVKQSHEAVLTFLERHGLDPSLAEVQDVQVTDRLAEYRSDPGQTRYVINQTVMVRSEEPEKIETASQAVGELIDAGVVLAQSGYGGGPTYLFTNLTERKPEMIAEATANARRAAEQFAEDSGSRIGKIRRANQGVFQILARDRARGISEDSQLNKTVRVVSTVDYYLDD